MQNKNKQRLLVNGIMILSGIPLLLSLGILISAASGYKMFPDLAFILPLFIGTAIFFVGQYFEGKYEETHGIDWYIHNRKVKMRTAIAGSIMSAVVASLSFFII